VSGFDDKEMEMANVATQGKDQEVRIKAGSISLDGNLVIPPGAQAVVLFAHGSGSSRFSPRNRFVAEVLRRGGLATLLFDLLTAEEETVDQRTRELRFNIDLLAERLVGATDWVGQQTETKALSIGYFGSSTGAAAALVAAAKRPDAVHAVVSRGGRPDLALPILAQVKAPTLLIVGGEDVAVIGMNKQALAQLRVESKLEIIPGASHLFEEPGTLEDAAHLARQWFKSHLVQPNSGEGSAVR
jgi:pimeloyl-ACP methyl ester carboxylesterase